MSVSGGKERVGGLVGLAAGGSIQSSYAAGDVTSGGYYAGGLVGRNSASITQSYAVGNVLGPGLLGGLVGVNWGNVTQSYATGSAKSEIVRGSIGGLVGRHFGTIRESYATGAVSGKGTPIGGLVGQDRGGAVLRGGSYWDRDSSGISESGGGAGKTSAELRSPTANTGIYGAWSSTAWDFGTSGQYPALKADWNGDGTATWQEFGNQRTPDAPTIGRVVWKSAESGLQLQVSWSAPSWDGGSPITAYDVRYIAADAEKALPANWTLLDSAWTSGSLEYGITGLQPGRRVVQVRGVNANGKGRWSAGGTLTGNNPPSFKETAPARTVAENTIAEMSIGEPVSATDPDGDALTYRLTGTEAAAFTIDASTGQLKTNAPLNYEKKAELRGSSGGERRQRNSVCQRDHHGNGRE